MKIRIPTRKIAGTAMAAVLSAACFLTGLPTNAMAAEVSEYTENAETRSADDTAGLNQQGDFIYVNPLYEDVYSDQDIDDALRQELWEESDAPGAGTAGSAEPSANANIASTADFANSAEAVLAQPGESLLSGVSEKGSPSSPISADEAVAFLRESQVNKSDDIVVYLSGDVDGNTVQQLWNDSQNHTGVPTEGDYLHYDFQGARIRFTYTPSTDTVVGYTRVEYLPVYYTTDAQEQQLTQRINDVLNNELNLRGRTDYAKVQQIYAYICSHVAYDNDHRNDTAYTLKYTAYAALIQGTAVCQGYASLFYRMCLQEGIDTRVIPGTSRGQGHAWNIVRMRDGLYYNADTTWDAGRDQASWNYFLVDNSHMYNHTRRASYDTSTFNAGYPMGTPTYQPSNDDLQVYFEDVMDPTAYYYPYVYWAKNNSITSGVSTYQFGVGRNCTRAEIVTLLYSQWRAAGNPALSDAEANRILAGEIHDNRRGEAAGTAGLAGTAGNTSVSLHFTDVPATAYYRSAVAWAIQNGITAGTSPTTFSPDDPCTRAQIVTFLYHAWHITATGRRGLTNETVGAPTFTDVTADQYYYRTVAWAVAHQVTSGTGNGRFSPDDPCTREQAITMLYKTFQ